MWNPCTLLVFVQTSRGILQCNLASAKLSTCIFYDPAVLFLITYCSIENLTQIRKRMKMVIAALFIVARSDR